MKDKKDITSFLLAVIFIVMVSYSTASCESSHLLQEQLTQVPKLLKRFHDASENDKKRAQELLRFADQNKKASKWGAAAKSYAESAMVSPSMRALLGLSVSMANIPRKRDICIDEITAKLRDFSMAADYMETAIVFSRKVHADETMVIEHQKALLEAYGEIVEMHERCMVRDAAKKGHLQR